ncbi:RecQ family ATP-dependent DNA helicase [Candidatus Gracilibacteria bacterium 28_42_T64]|nr:RecQ family ATP-dependent DNA helicase [Candidatus Gracilibacteria bacterium 28_42_T64]
MDKLESILQGTFGLKSFREGQREVIESVVNGNDTLVFMPTGGGKSLTYQLPGMVREGVTLVISPLISLMKDQVDKLNELGVRAELINSTISFSEQQDILNELSKGNTNIKFLYIAPERLNSRDFQRIVGQIKISLIAIDEVHCLSQWGHDFRPSYMKIKGFIERLRGEEKNIPVVGLTATATEKVRVDIVTRLGLTKYREFTKGFDRKNIILIVRELSKKDEKFQKLYEIIKNTAGSGIVYCSSRKVTKEVYEFLQENDISVGMYTGAMNHDDRETMQQQFMDDGLKVIVATNAFGMGIDKKDIRFVVHYNLPGSIENYYQEVGRGGRDGKKSYGVVLASYGDTKIQEFFIENSNPEKQEILDFYDYLYKNNKIGEGSGEQILKTYYVMASESGVGNDMKVGSILKLLEKYGIVRKGFEGESEDNFRGRGITLMQEKRKHSGLLIDWKHQELLRDEAYFKLEQIKKLLFYPSCRKKFILQYFGDKEDLKTLPDNCGVCDYCLDKSKYQSGDIENLVQLSVFEIVLDVMSKFDKRFGVKVITNFLRGSSEKRIIEWGLDKHEDYGVLSEYNSELVEALIEALIQHDYLEKTTGQYPLLGMTKVGTAALRNEDILKEDESNLQSFLIMKVKRSAFKKAKTGSSGDKKAKTPRGATYKETLKLLKEGKSLKKIAGLREIKILSIEGHVLKLYEDGELGLQDILKLVDFKNIKEVKVILEGTFGGVPDKLRPIKDKLEEEGKEYISYFEIKACISMLGKGDL